jgi:hypothetical protein
MCKTALLLLLEAWLLTVSPTATDYGSNHNWPAS